MVEQLDGLGLVYEKRGNTGAAAYEQSDRVDPFARVTNQLANDLQREQRNIEINQEKKDRANLEVLKGLGDIKGWEIDNQAFIYNEANQLKNEAQQLVTKGKNLSDLFDPEVRVFNEKTQRLAQQAPLSVQQGKVIEAMKMDVMKNPQKYDTEETRKALEAYSAMTPSERMNTPVESLFVPKYNKFSLLPKLPEIAKWSDPVGSRGEVKFNEAKARESMALTLDTEQGQADYKAGVEEGDWTTPEEMIAVNLAKAKTMFQEKLARYVAPRPSTFVSPTEVATSIRGTEPVPLGFTADVETIKDGKTTFETKNLGSVSALGLTNLGAVKLTIPKSIAESRGGLTFDKDLELNSGNLGVALFNNKTGKYEKDSKTGKYNIGGKEYTLEEAIKAGLLKYKPILSGQVDYYNSQQDIVVDPTKYAKLINSNSKDYREYNIILNEQSRYAEELNNKYKGTETNPTTSTTTKPTTGTSGDKPKDPPKQKSKEPKMSYPQWKAKNPKGTPTQFKTYQNS